MVAESRWCERRFRNGHRSLQTLLRPFVPRHPRNRFRFVRITRTLDTYTDVFRNIISDFYTEKKKKIERTDRDNMKSSACVSTLVCLVALFGSSAGLKCYTCGWWNKNCGDPFLKDDYLLVECNTRAINDFNRELGNTLNVASNALQNFANQVGFNLNQHNSFNNLPTISEDSVGCSKVVLKHGEDIVRVARGCVYNQADLCKGMQRLDDELKTLKYCGTCDDNGCNGSRALESSAVAIFLTAAVSCLFYYGLH